MPRSAMVFATLLLLSIANGAVADETEVEAQTVLADLSNPWGLTIQPRTDRLFLSNSGAGEVLRIHLTESEEGSRQVVGFPTALAGPGGKYRLGPLGLAFVDHQTLLVGSIGKPDEGGAVRLYDVRKPEETLQWEQRLAAASVTPDREEQPAGSHGFPQLLATPQAIFVAVQGPDPRGFIGRIDLGQPPIREIEPFVQPEGAQFSGLAALTFTPEQELVAGFGGGLGPGHDSSLAIFGGRTGRVLLRLPVPLNDLVGLAHNPRSGRLYALDFSSANPAQGGLFRLDYFGAGKIRASKVLSVEWPTSMVFTSGGVLYLTALDRPPDADGLAGGRLLRVTGEL